jgi:hypothetical protein
LGVQSATTTLTRTITVAAGVFAPGHIGELTRYVPLELVDAVLTETGAVQRRLRDLPSRVGVYFVLALALFPRLGYRRVWDKLVAGLAGLAVPTPSEKALRDLRRRVGIAPFMALFQALAGPLAQPGTPGARYRRYRTVAFDGCSSLKAPDAERNRSWLGKIRNQFGWAGYPTLMLMALVETGTRGLLGADFGLVGGGNEVKLANKLLPLLRPDMLLLVDRGFDSNDFLTSVADTGAQILGRITALRRPPVLAALPDGSFLTMVNRRRIRVIDATITVTTATNNQITGHYRLMTTLLDHRIDPADVLIRLYHERWEIESAFYALRHTILDGQVLRSHDPIGLHQELWALLTIYQALRIAMVTATETRPATDPDRASFTIALEHARHQVIHAANILPDPTDPLGVIGHAILANLMPPRRARTSIRKVKSSTSRYAAYPTTDQRPATSTTITATTITVHPRLHTPPPATRYRRQHPHTTPTSRKERVLALLRTQPERHWHPHDIAQQLDQDNTKGFRVQLAGWARQGLIDKPRPGIYTWTASTAP